MLKVDDWVRGEVIKILKQKNNEEVEIGALIKLETNHIGLLHISEVSNGFTKKVSDHLKIGEDRRFRIVSHDTKTNRLSLSLIDKSESKPKPKQKSFKQTNKTPKKPATFEDKIKAYLKESEEKQQQLQRNKDRKQGSSKHKKK